MMTLDEVINAILTDDETEISAEAKNALHGAKSSHPWGKGKDFDQRKLEARFAVAGRKVNANHVHRLERARS